LKINKEDSQVLVIWYSYIFYNIWGHYNRFISSYPLINRFCQDSWHIGVDREIGRIHNSPDGSYWYIYLPMAYHQHQWLSLVLSIGNQFCRQTTVKLELPTRAFHKTKWWPQVLKEEFEDTNSIQFKALFRVDINHTYNTSF
jgi:hypothetical protein